MSDDGYGRSRASIFFPVFSIGQAKLVIVLLLVLLVAVSALVPDTAEGGSWLLVQQMILVGYKDIGSLSEGSSYRLVVIVGFSMAVILSLVAAIVLSLTRINMHAFRAVEEKSYLSRVLTVGVILVFLLLPIFQELPNSELQFSYHVLKAMWESRLLIIGASVAYFVLSLSFWVLVLFEVSNILGRRSSTRN
ncbi:hypothetical protein LOY28_17675 [Pseudomonas sp. B21-017]|jgi:hypothetical protein|uniref:hypothetical protein n=1 Tax=unclassified Pseudomonas TaxID=196821 RepID=UPI000DAF45A0|nr:MULTISPECIES: hypothetical protein [unclassified Pseudomonas]PZW63972.1 hypothetical protein F475_01216 [Pseudomonas sp. URMO17WK12:I6]UVM36551.1 hypothetical protein LOY28_17675 [Pseudomonas sp. B21-017]